MKKYFFYQTTNKSTSKRATLVRFLATALNVHKNMIKLKLK